MFLNPEITSALDRIAQRAADVRRAFEPGALPENDDVAVAEPGAEFTLDPLAVAPPEGTYFVVGDRSGGVAYTRDGTFHLSGGMLVDAAGRPVLGARSPGAALAPLHIDAVDAALGRADDAAVDASGALSYARVTIDPRTGARDLERVVAGRIALARFPAATRLESTDGVTSRAPSGVVPHTGLPGDGSFEPVQPMHRRRSSVDLDESLARLKAAYVAFDAMAAAAAAKSRLGKTALDLVK